MYLKINYNVFGKFATQKIHLGAYGNNTSEGLTSQSFVIIHEIFLSYDKGYFLINSTILLPINFSFRDRQQFFQINYGMVIKSIWLVGSGL